MYEYSCDWAGADVTKALADYSKLMTYTNKDRDTFDWTDAEKLIMDGKAGYQLMGDWEAADLDAKGFKDYGFAAFPGNKGVFQWLADSFVLPKGAKNPDGTKCWLKTVGSAEGQKAFNTKKGSIPARTDAVASAFPAYQQSAIGDWKSLKQVPSCAHGSACSQGLPCTSQIRPRTQASVSQLGSQADSASGGRDASRSPFSRSSRPR